MASDTDIRKTYLEWLSRPVYYKRRARPIGGHLPRWESLETPESGMPAERLFTKKTWVWSDQHFGHKNIIHYSERPFENVEEMTEQMVANFNSCVSEDDASIWVGDVAFLHDDQTNEIVNRCNGYKILVVGNHDFNRKKLKKLNFDEILLYFTYETPEFDLVFTHYPIEHGLPWPDYVNVHGHVHVGKNPVNTLQHINVNCEFHDYKPIELDTIVQWAQTRVRSHDE